MQRLSLEDAQRLVRASGSKDPRQDGEGEPVRLEVSGQALSEVSARGRDKGDGDQLGHSECGAPSSGRAEEEGEGEAGS